MRTDHVSAFAAHAGTVPGAAEVADRLAIMEILALHCRGVDRADGTLLKAAYWPDATVRYGGFNGNAHAFCERLPEGIRRFRATQHSITNTQIVPFGTRALVESYITAYHYMAAPDGDTEMTFLGRYLDVFERRGAQWKMRRRTVIMDWNQNAKATAVLEGPPFAGLTPGSREPEDPWYVQLAELAAGGPLAD